MMWPIASAKTSGSALQLACAAAEVRDVRGSVLAALERDRQMAAGPLQIGLLDRYLATSAEATDGGGGTMLGGGPAAAAASSGGATLSAAERRELLAARASARLGPSAAEAAPVALKTAAAIGGDGATAPVGL